jgi:SHOCT-like protein
MSISEERLRILKMIESGQVSAEQGSQLIEALVQRQERERPRGPAQPRTLRVRVTDLNTRRQKINVTIPVSLVGIGLKLGARLARRMAIEGANADQIIRAIEDGSTGRIFEVQDLDEGERVEIFVE